MTIPVQMNLDMHLLTYNKSRFLCASFQIHEVDTISFDLPKTSPREKFSDNEIAFAQLYN